MTTPLTAAPVDRRKFFAVATAAGTVDQRRGNRNDEGGFVEALKRWFN